jgi:amino acid transporter
LSNIQANNKKRRTKMRFVDFLIGAAVLLMGVVPLLSNVSAVSNLANIVGKPGEIVYQGILIAIGLLTLLYAFNDRKPVRRI